MKKFAVIGGVDLQVLTQLMIRTDECDKPAPFKPLTPLSNTNMDHITLNFYNIFTTIV